MNNLQNQNFTLNSREVAVMVGKQHDQLMRSIRTYVDYLDSAKLQTRNFFTESSYLDNQNKNQPCYLITKKGCDMVANKMTGEKGVLFTARYIERFYEMEKQSQRPMSQLEVMAQSIQILQDQQRQIEEVKKEIKITKSRIDTLDGCDIAGNPQQKLNAMIRKYALQEGVSFPRAWKEFRKNYNTAFRTNVKLAMSSYKMKHSIRNLSLPQFLTLTGFIEDGLRVADKMLNSAA